MTKQFLSGDNKLDVDVNTAIEPASGESKFFTEKKLKLLSERLI